MASLLTQLGFIFPAYISVRRASTRLAKQYMLIYDIVRRRLGRFNHPSVCWTQIVSYYHAQRLAENIELVRKVEHVSLFNFCLVFLPS